ncbi:MAG: ABC transporter substrate-binding protein [Alphaproteobacteria bacterium]
MRVSILAKALAVTLALGATPVLAQERVKIVNVAELSGPGATAGTNWRNGAELAAIEINARGGILGRQIELVHYDSQTNPGVSRALIQRGIDENAYAILGPVFSGPISASMQIAQRAKIAQIVGGEATGLTRQGNPFIFRTSLSQADAMPKLANYMRDSVKAQSVAVVWVNNDFGKGGRDAMIAELQKRNMRVVADIATEQGQADFAADAIRVKNANPDAIFVYLNEEESARFLRAARQQGIDKPLIGETTLLGQKVIELAGDAANGVRGHVGLSIDAPVPAFQDFGRRYQARFNTAPDHNGIKGFIAVYMIKAITERVGRFDREALAAGLRGARITPAQEPGILIDTVWTETGDIDRESFLGEVRAGRQVITTTLPFINPPRTN